QDHGRVTERDGVLKIAWELQELGWPGDLPPDFLIVRWDRRRYLVPPEDVLTFCVDARSGREPRRGVHGMYYLRRGDEDKPATGKPDLPKGFEKYWTMKPIQGLLTKVGPESVTALKDAWKHDKVTQDVTLDVGRAEGVLP